MILRTFSLLLLATLFLTSCRDDEEAIVTNSPNDVLIDGFVQKGPFLNGTSLIASELNDAFAATGKVFTTQISDNQGTFVIKASQLDHSYLQFIASGFYFDEVRGEKSSAQLTLFALANISGTDATVNVNVLSHLEKDRALFLVEQGESFVKAKQQAQREILAIFGIERDGMLSSEQLNIFRDGDDHAILLAISAILQGDNTVAELSELLANITNDLQEDGTLDGEKLAATLRQNAMNLNLPAIRQHLLKRYQELEIDAAIPNFEQYIDSDGDGFLNKDEDDTPDDFAFVPQIDVAVDTLVVSNEAVVSGLKENGVSDIRVFNGQIIINGQAINDSTAQVKNGDRIQVQVTSSGNYADKVIATVQIGSYLQYFKVITDDYIPNSFSFSGQEDVAVETFHTSNTITLSGLPHTTWAHIAGGILLKNNKEIEADSVTIVDGDQIAMKVQSSSEYATTTTSYLTITGVEVSFVVTTDDYSPDDFQFTPVENATLDSVYTSETITLSGLPHLTPIHLDSGILLINGRQVDHKTAQVMTGDQIAIQLFTKNNYETESVALLRVGAIEISFHVATPINIWQKKPKFPGRSAYDQASFVINGKIYVGLGESPSDEFYQYDPTSDQWTAIANFPSIVQRPTGFSINGKGYIYANNDCIEDAVFAEYDPSSNAWTKRAEFPGPIDCNYISFSVGNYGYVGQENFWRYDPSEDEWIQVATFPSYGGQSVTFSTDSKGYVILSKGSKAKEFWEYNPISDTWKQLSDYPGLSIDYDFSTKYVIGIGFVVGEYAYVGSKSTDRFPNKGENNSFWKYDFKADTWKEIHVGLFHFSDTFSIGSSSKGYHLTTEKTENYESRYYMYEFTPPQE